MKLFALFILHCMVSPSVLAYRDGARENSCYDHSINHGAGTETFDCEPPSCPFFLRIREVVNDTTLELGNETTMYQCGQVYGIELVSTLNDPEGFLIQARNGTNISSEIIGTFLDPAVVRVKSPAAQVNYKILNCNRSMDSKESLPNSATHPTTVGNAGILQLQLYWQAPDCSTCGLGDVDLRFWFTVVQQLQIVFTTSKVTELRLQNYTEPAPMHCSSSLPTRVTTVYTDNIMETSPTVTMHKATRSTTESSEASAGPSCVAATSTAAVLCSFLFFFGAISGGLSVFWITTCTHQQRRAKRDHQLPLDPLYEDLSESATPKMRTALSISQTEALESNVELETNAAYGHSESNVEMETNAAYGHVESNVKMGINAAYGNVVTSESNIEMGTNAAYGRALTS